MSVEIKEKIRQEYKLCASNPAYFLTKYGIIQHPQKGKIPFRLYPFQGDALEQFKTHDYNIVLKGRQIGFSTLVAGYALWLMLFQTDKNVLVIATKQETAKNLVTKVRVMHQNLPSWLRGICIEDNKLSLKFKNGSQIKAVSSASDSARSESLSLLVVDEAAFIDEIDAIWSSAQATLSTGGKAIVLSTPNGVGGFFHKQWLDAIEGRGVFNHILLDWKVVPGRDEKWRKMQTDALGDKMARQEHDADFLATGNAVIDPDITEWYKENVKKEPLEKRGIDGNLWIWKYPDRTKSYIVCADVSRGDASDFSAFHVLDVDTAEQVAEYKGVLDTNLFGDLLVAVSTEYNDALLVIENANVGWAVIQQVINRQYKNLYYTEKDHHYIDPTAQVSNKYRALEKKRVAGFTTSTRTRPLIISKLNDYMRAKEEGVLVRSQRTLDEISVFIWKNSKPEAMDGYNDDLVMSLAIGLWIRDTALQLRQQGIELTKLALDRIQRSSYDGVYTPSPPRDNPLEMEINGETESLAWLL